MKSVTVPIWPVVLGVAALALFRVGAQGQGGPVEIPRLTAEQTAILSHMSLVQLDDGVGGHIDTIRITGVNVQIVSGLGATNGVPSDPTIFNGSLVNGAGNLIVGYDEYTPGSVRTGSHNIVLGFHNDYSSFGGLVGGTDNALIGPASTVCGGYQNVAGSIQTAILGGEDNETNGVRSAVGGGTSQRANYDHTWIGGGRVNSANAPSSSIAGGAGVVTTEQDITGCGGLYLKP